jgi:hypothetical protein
MSQSGTSTLTAQRIERLLRSLVGVSELRVQWHANSLRAVHILRDSRVQPHQLIRNVVSGLHAGVGIAVLPTQVHVHDDDRTFASVAAAPHVAPAAPAGPERAAPSTNGAHGHGNGTSPRLAADSIPAQNGSRAESRRHELRGRTADAAVEPTMTARPSKFAGEAIAAAAELLKQRTLPADGSTALQLDRIDVERRGAMLRCRTVLSLNGRTYSAIAEVPHAPAAEAELAARVAVDALRAGGLTEATLDGVGFITISDVNYCVATVREPGRIAPRAGAAPMIDSMAASATAAALAALGKYTDARPQTRVRAGT